MSRSPEALRLIRACLTPRRVWRGGVLVLALGAAVLWARAAGLDWRALMLALESLHTVTVLALAALLPVAGFPISVVYLLIGARFGPAAGLGLIAALTAGHLIGTHCIARGVFRARLQRFMARHHHRLPAIPAGENAAVSLMIMLAPAIPYFIRNYALALSGIPLRIYFGIALGIHVARSCVALFLGDFGTDPSQKRFYILAVFYGLKLTIFAVVAWWLRKRHQRLKRQPALHAALGKS